MRTYQCEPVSDVQCQLGEGPRWDAERGELIWVDILGGIFRRGAWRGGRLEVLACHDVGDTVGAVTTVRGGGYLAAADTGFVFVPPGEGAEAIPVAHTPAASTEVRMNDAQCDPAGRFWAGTMPFDTSRTGAGSLYRLDADGSVATVLPHVTISNGLAWSSDLRTMYYVDSADDTVWAFDFAAADSSITNRRPFYVHHGDGVPDGICRDDDDHLWVAINGGGELRRYAPDGTQVATVVVPGARQVSSCALGGPDGRTMFATTAFENLSAEQHASQPHAGLVHAVQVEVAGPPMTPFAGAIES